MRTKLTYLDYVALPEDGKRYELIDGVLIEMAAPAIKHQIICDELGGQLRVAMVAKPLVDGVCQFFSAPVDIRLPTKGTTPDCAQTVVQPDLCVYCEPSNYDGKGGKCAPDFAIEILSPSSITHDRVRKLKLYEAHGFKVYWIVDGDQRTMRVYRQDGEQFAPVETFAFDCQVPVRSVPGLSLDLAQLARVLDRAERIAQI